MWKAIPVQAEDMAKSSPPYLLHLICDVDVGAFCDLLVCYSLLVTYSQDSSSKTSESSLCLLDCTPCF